ncbi:GNAT family N-acetyltransferase [Clostridium sp. KNHs214]|uniref:GNAT family N-acetyltransferase n=1 Tax=Clostridium sp. KNHs214 TaxID=1540257 RepID=UPI00068A0E96|nr:GNAT family N-acetyltransferase [Clostridium sp. KNHs214]
MLKIGNVKTGELEKVSEVILKKRCFKREGNLIYIKKPQFYELTYVKKLWANEETMKDVGGALDFSKEKWDSWYKKMVEPGDGRNFYCLIYNNEHQSVGEVSFHRYDEINKTAEFNIKIESKYRGRGYANEAMKLMLKYYFYEFGGEVMLDEVINVNGQQALKKFGFEVISSAEESISFRMTKERFEEIV